jgi:bifunctional non-homologous end joining protein LigD
VIQEHHATALHWDFRLERGGVLVSWAIPKGLPPDPKRNHLAVQTEDHPLEYATFEGGIPRGEYGGGEVTIWDRGTYECDKWSDREVKVTLHGERSSGRYVLFHTGGKNWMIHRMDPAPAGWEPMPETVLPMRAMPGKAPAEADRYGFELDWGGARTVAYVDGGRIRLTDADGTDVTAEYPQLRALGLALGSTRVVLDGEIMTYEGRGRKATIAFVITDVLYLDGRDTTRLPYEQRRALLESLALRGPSWDTPPLLPDFESAMASAAELGLAGVVAKRLDSPYKPGQRSRAWVTCKGTLLAPDAQ